MFNLEQSIATWRNQMFAAGIPGPIPLEELELHLREEIGRNMDSGLTAQAAFEISILEIGEPRSLNREFAKNQSFAMTRIAKISAALASLLFGAALMLP